MLDQDLIFLNVEAKKSEDVIIMMGKVMQAKNYVKDDYIDEVLKREKSLPTGLDTKDMHVAIPHTDSRHVNKSSIGIAILKHPVQFNMMVDPDKRLDIDIVFLLAVKDPNSQVKLLKSLMSVFQNRQLLSNLKLAKSKKKVIELLRFIAI
jgi:galactitol PTS system EIIA component